MGVFPAFDRDPVPDTFFVQDALHKESANFLPQLWTRL
jgi:hypothetical protein